MFNKSYSTFINILQKVKQPAGLQQANLQRWRPHYGRPGTCDDDDDKVYDENDGQRLEQHFAEIEKGFS